MAELAALDITGQSGKPINQGTPATQEPAKQPDQMDPKFAHLARKEKMIRDQQRQLQQEKESILRDKEQMKKEYEQNYIPKKNFQAPETAIQTLLDNGISYDQITQYFLAKPNEADPVFQELRAVKAELASLRSSQDESKKQYEDSQSEQYQQALKQISSEVNLLVNTDGNFETIKATGRQREVVKLIENYFKEHGEILSIDEAARVVEEASLEEAIKIAQLKKVKDKIIPQNTTQVATQPGQLKTLTNQVSTNSKPLSRKERAILAFKGQLK